MLPVAVLLVLVATVPLPGTRRGSSPPPLLGLGNRRCRSAAAAQCPNRSTPLPLTEMSRERPPRPHGSAGGCEPLPQQPKLSGECSPRPHHAGSLPGDLPPCSRSLLQLPWQRSGCGTNAPCGDRSLRSQWCGRPRPSGLGLPLLVVLPVLRE